MGRSNGWAALKRAGVAGAGPKQRRVLRGGSFNNNARNVRCAYRNRNDPDNRNRNIGFRVVLSTFFQHRNCPVGHLLFRAEVKNGGSRSRPRPGTAGPGL